ncbi:hypothetical protein [Leptotrichia hofstadii]|uniref:Uncharacterized protein n=1 Tax=Leptotrichia hofstadii F0254 TaxID=634994 RepID=C9MWC9_9FUSO|nr:hypothetical protein [Leptotrichia hofstadii]EEX74795.1 hypothetical protein GCWU000323_00850 [Leptotrichia hofstadii F0254]
MKLLEIFKDSKKQKTSQNVIDDEQLKINFIYPEDEEIAKIVENEVLAHRNLKQILKIKNELEDILNENIKPGPFEYDLVGHDCTGTYYYENIWFIDLLVAIYEYTDENKKSRRKICCEAILSDFYYFGVTFPDKVYADKFNYIENISDELYEKALLEEQRLKKKLYKFSYEYLEEVNNKKIQKFINFEISRHKNEYEKEEIVELENILKQIIYNIDNESEEEDTDIIKNKIINFIGNSKTFSYQSKNIWIIELVIKILENYSQDLAKYRALFCMELLNQLYLFEIEDLDLNELNKTEFEMIRKKLYQYYRFYDKLRMERKKKFL